MYCIVTFKGRESDIRLLRKSNYLAQQLCKILLLSKYLNLLSVFFISFMSSLAVIGNEMSVK